MQAQVKETGGAHARIRHDEDALDAQSNRIAADMVGGSAPTAIRGGMRTHAHRQSCVASPD
jgi:hypothetical protein